MTYDLNKERSAILAVIEAETEAYLNRDYDAWQKCWLDGSETRRVQTHIGTGVTVAMGDEIKAQMKQTLSNPISWQPPENFKRDNMNVVISPEMAWVSYHQTGDMSSKEDAVLRQYHELKILQKIDHTWKISCLVSTQIRQNQTEVPLIEVDEFARIKWMNESAKMRLPKHPILTTKLNKLSVPSQDINKSIQDALDWLCEIRNHLTPGLGEENVGRIVSLGQDDTGMAHVCWTLLRDGKLLIAFDDQDRLKLQIISAASAYGLSDTQSKLALILVSGADISTAAKQLKVSPNTAKTHLQRIYDKLGIRSQPAMVRMLLTAARREI